MAASNSPSRSIDGVYANYAETREYVQITIANSGTLVVGQPVSLLNSTLGPAGGTLALPAGAFGTSGRSTAPVCEQVVATNATGAGILFGVFTGYYRASNSSSTFAAAGISNTSGASVLYTIEVMRQGFGPVFVGAFTAGTAVTVGASLIATTTQTCAFAGTAALFGTIGKAIGQYNVTSIAAATSTGSQVVIPGNMDGITTTTPVIVDIGTLQETVTPSAITAGTADRFTATFVNAHAANTPIAVISTTNGATLFAVPTTASTLVSGTVYAYIQVC